MAKVIVFASLFFCYIIYSCIIFTKGTDDNTNIQPDETVSIQKGKNLFQQHNCIACHQIYGLGGYLGPELTTDYSNAAKGEMYMKAFLQAGGQRMPNFFFQKDEIDDIIHYLKYVDATATSYKVN
jgi:nitric oxide reductase subunit C